MRQNERIQDSPWEPKGGWANQHPWMKRAYDFARATKGYFPIRLGSDEYPAWEAYFDRLGWAPWAFRRLKEPGQEQAEWTAPCQFPEWLTIGTDSRAAE